MRKINIHILSALLIAIVLVGCNRKITRIDPSSDTDLGGRWNDTDSRFTSQELVEEILSGSWLTDFYQNNNGEKPVVIVGLVRNKSHEHIEAETFIKDVEKSFIESGRVRLVQGGAKREEVRAERADQQDNASQSTMKQWGLEIGADFMLQGSINSIVDQYKREKTTYYQVNAELTHMQTNEIVWIGDKKIKKFIKN